jgi:PGF-pre-PGF domain-containing protein
VLYSEGTSGRAWNLQYRNDSLCNNTDRWYIGSQSGWTTTSASGCPDSHIHLARRTDYIDGVNLTVTANYTDGNSSVDSFTTFFVDLPNLAPESTSFLNPQNGTYSGFINITWAASLDPNRDTVTYNLSLLNSDASFNQTLNNSTTSTSYYWDSSTISDGTYDLLIEACDTLNLCSNFTLGGSYDNFTIDNIITTTTTNNSNDSPNRGSLSIISRVFEKYTNKNTNILEIGVIIIKDSIKELDISNPKNTNIKRIILDSNGYLSGDIKIKKLSEKPSNCLATIDDNLVYTILEIESNLDKNKIDEVSIHLDIENSWKDQRNITLINALKCNQSNGEIKTELIENKANFSEYSFSSNGFSTWVIYGEQKTNSSNSESIDQNNLGFIFIILLILITIYLVYKKYQIKNKN